MRTKPVPKKALTVGIFILFGLSNVSTVSGLSAVNSLSMTSILDWHSLKNRPVDSYHAFYENNTWTVVSCNFTEPTNVNFSILQRRSYNDTSDITYFNILAITRNGELLYREDRFGLDGPYRYFQSKFGPINISYYQSPPSYQGWGYSSTWFYLMNCTGRYDFLVISYGPASTLEVNMNVSTDTTFSATYGHEVFAFHRADFIGTLNIGWKHGTIMLKGEKQITVKNSLVCSFNAWWSDGFGYELLRYQTPSGNLAHHFAINFQYRTFLDRASPTFDSTLWFGEKGLWTFTANYFMVVSSYFPDLMLAGADVQLPSNCGR